MFEEANVNQEPKNLDSFQCDDLLEKLKLLNYEKYLLQSVKMKPLSKFYFLNSTNPGEQFFMFTLLCWWLCKKLGKDMEKPQEFDDPNVVIANILQILSEMDISVDFSPNKLIRGAGPVCLHVLDSLATQVLKVTKTSFQRLHIAEEDEIAADYLEDNAEIILEKLEEGATLSDDSDMELDGNTFKHLDWVNQIRKNDNTLNVLDTDQLHDNLVDNQQWRLELERVLPQLKVFVKPDARDWRAHIAQIESFKTNIEEISEETYTHLKKLHSEFTFSLDKVESREKHLNNELQSLVNQFKDISIELSNVQYAQQQVHTDSDKLMLQLNDVIAENDIKKSEMERRGQMMSDGSSVIQIKKAIAKLNDDIAHLNLEVALLVHSIDQDILGQLSMMSNANSSQLSPATKSF